MNKGYTMLSDGTGSDWGQCILVDECLGLVIKGEKTFDTLPQKIIDFFLECDDQLVAEGLNKFLFNKNNYKGFVYNFINNTVDITDNEYMLKFINIAELANYVRKNKIEVENLLY